MWLSERKKRKNESCVVGTVSISGDKCGVVGFKSAEILRFMHREVIFGSRLRVTMY